MTQDVQRFQYPFVRTSKATSVSYATAVDTGLRSADRVYTIPTPRAKAKSLADSSLKRGDLSSGGVFTALVYPRLWLRQGQWCHSSTIAASGRHKSQHEPFGKLRMCLAENARTTYNPSYYRQRGKVGETALCRCASTDCLSQRFGTAEYELNPSCNCPQENAAVVGQERMKLSWGEPERVLRRHLFQRTGSEGTCHPVSNRGIVAFMLSLDTEEAAEVFMALLLIIFGYPPAATASEHLQTSLECCD